MMRKYLTNWKTTSSGILLISTAITRAWFAYQEGRVTEEAVITIITTFLTGVGFLFSRDYDKSTEETKGITNEKASS